MIAIPGNHDKLLRNDLDIYDSWFVDQLRVDSVHRRGTRLVHRRIKERDFLFILLDANVYASNRLTIGFRARKHLARGRVDESQLSELVEKLDKLRSGNNVDNVTIPDFKRAFKILIIHYAVDAALVTGGGPDPIRYVLPHECDGVNEFISSLADYLDLAIHGHLHEPRLYNTAGVPIISVGTASQKGATMPSFYLLKFERSGQVHAEHHIWKGQGFTKDLDPNMNRPMN
jgi:predicted phosphodiesterase